MLHAALLTAALTASSGSSMHPKTAIAQCLATMDGAVYHGDPSDRQLMTANVATCAKSIAETNALRPTTAAQGPQKLFISARVLDRAATLTYIGLGDSTTALREVKMANLYFRIAAGLRDQTAEYHNAALANAQLTHIQLQTLNAEGALADRPHPHARMVAAYHKL